jgi:hypothetical protein
MSMKTNTKFSFVEVLLALLVLICLGFFTHKMVQKYMTEKKEVMTIDKRQVIGQVLGFRTIVEPGSKKYDKIGSVLNYDKSAYMIDFVDEQKNEHHCYTVEALSRTVVIKESRSITLTQFKNSKNQNLYCYAY